VAGVVEVSEVQKAHKPAKTACMELYEK